METFTFQARIDSKGRITVPANLRNKFDLEKGDRIALSLQEGTIIKKEVSSREAVKIIESLEAEEFRYSQGVLEVIQR